MSENNLEQVDQGQAPQVTEPQAVSAEVNPSENLPQLSEGDRVALLEALLFAHGEPLPVSRAQEIMGLPKSDILAVADKLAALLGQDQRGLELVVVAEKLQLRTQAKFAEYVRQLMAVKPRKLSQAALETLAVVAYQQPVVKSEIDKIRGVDVAPTIKTLLERKLVKIIGYQASVGQPALYGTTDEFLEVFGLPSLSSLPSIQDLRALVREPGEAQEDADAPIEQIEPSQEGELLQQA
jgi:segregation and condensation protein B